MSEQEIEQAIATHSKTAISAMIYSWIKENKISCSEIAQLISEYYRQESTGKLESSYSILDGLNGWCIDDELAINWGIQNLYNRFSRFGNNDGAKKEAVRIVQELINDFKSNGGKENGKLISEGNA